ncbi:MAG: amino acid adenylation domain-containing protein, partial [Cellvibrionaceae bacterium]
GERALGDSSAHSSSDSKLESMVPSTEAQRELWLAAQMGDDSNCAFNESVTLQMRGALDRQTLLAALDQLIQRHDVLRACFSRDGRELLIQKRARAFVEVVDLAGESASAAQDKYEALRTKAVAEPFDVSVGPLARFTLVNFKDDRHALIMTFHHIVCDGWSIYMLAQELGNLYLAWRRGESLPPAPSFADYARWERSADIEAKHRASLDYWRQTLATGTPFLELPLDKARPPVKTYGASRIDRRAAPDFVAKAKKIAASQRATLTSVLIAGFAGFACRLTGQRDILLGIPFAGQLAKGDMDLVGHCVNVLPITITVVEEESFEQLLSRVQDQIKEAFNYQYLSYGTLLQSLRFDRDPSRPSLVSVLFNVDLNSEESWECPELEVGLASNPRCFENLDMNWNITVSGASANFECTFNRDLWHDKTITDRLEELETFLHNICAAPSQAIGELDIMSSAEQARLRRLSTGPSVVREFAHLNQLLDLRQHTEREAVICEGQSLSYLELDARSSQLANHLLAMGVERGALLGVFVERSIDMLVSCLAVWKAGAAYVPLDPAYPTDRLLYMLETAQVAVLLTQSRLADVVADYDCPRVCVDRDGATIAEYSSQAPSVELEGEDPAYVIFTSGSTGKPKGVQIPHRAVINFLLSMADQPGLGARDRLLAVTTLSFDIAVLELYLPLLVGARLAIASRDAVLDGSRLRKLVDEQNITAMQATPSTWRLLLAAGWRSRAGFKVLCGGEAFPPDLARQLVDGGGEVWNMYGPTESTVWSTCYRITQMEDTIPIGKPIANTQCLVLDKRLKELPPGVPGELYIGGAGVASGYLARPELTAERFVANPLDPNARVYRTGDQAKWRLDGSLECLGRLDDQVKLRGFRIELGEIESVLGSHPDVLECAAVVKRYGDVDHRLVAYARTAKGKGLNSTEMRRYLREFLPDYMIPQFFVTVDALPLTPNGKVDRHKLPDPMLGLAQSDPVVKPRTEIEKALANIWSELLQKKQEGVNEFFFDVGGHSMLAIDMIGKIEDQFSVRISPLDILLNTLEQIAVKIDHGTPRGGEQTAAIEQVKDIARSSAGVRTSPKKRSFIGRLFRGSLDR